MSNYRLNIIGGGGPHPTPAIRSTILRAITKKGKVPIRGTIKQRGVGKLQGFAGFASCDIAPAPLD